MTLNSLPRRQFIALTALLPLRGLASSRGPSGFRGLAWQAAPPARLQLLPGSTKDGLSTYVPRPSSGPLEPWEGLAVVEEGFMFERNRLYAGHLFFAADIPMASIVQRLIALYGKPDFVNPALGLHRWRLRSPNVDVMAQGKPGGKTQVSVQLK